MSRHHGGVDLSGSIIAVIGLSVIAGGGIIVVDSLIIRRLRQGAKPAHEARTDADDDLAVASADD